MQITNELFEEITEGKTKLMVPKKSLTEVVPPKEPAFFNPKARLNRDFSIIAYGAFLKKFQGPKIFLEGLSGIGARGLRVAKELDAEKVVINDLNPSALEIAKFSADLNGLKNIECCEKEICRFFSNYSKKGNRGSIVDIDPFGSPAQFFDCGLRATMHGGILSCTATDLQVLNGLFQNACKRKYGGIQIRTEYGNEIAIRLVLGCLRSVSGRLGLDITPLYVESNMHYYRIYVRVYNRPDQKENLGYIIHCKGCGNRKLVKNQLETCEICESQNNIGGPLWIDRIFDREFLEEMILKISELNVDKKCEKSLRKCISESEIPGVYYTLDELASKMKSSPPKLERVIEKLKNKGFVASATSFNPTGFRTDANIKEIMSLFSD